MQDSTGQNDPDDSLLTLLLPNETHVLRFKPRLVQMRLTRSLIASEEKQGMQEVCYHGNGKSPHSSRDPRDAEVQTRVNKPALMCKTTQNWTSPISELLIMRGHVHPCSENLRSHFNRNRRFWEFPTGAKLFHNWVQMLTRTGLILTNRTTALRVHRCTITQCTSASQFR